MRLRRLILSLIIALAAASRLPIHAQSLLPTGAVSIVNQDEFGGRVALCAQTGGQNIQQGARRIKPTAVWVGRGAHFHMLNAGLGACDPAWSPDGRRVAVTAASGLWIFPADSAIGSLRVQARLPIGESTEYTYRAFAHPEWSPDGVLVALVVSNGGTAWVEVYEASSGKLFYTSPPEMYAFKWGSTARDLKVGKLDVHLPPHP